MRIIREFNTDKNAIQIKLKSQIKKEEYWIPLYNATSINAEILAAETAIKNDGYNDIKTYIFINKSKIGIMCIGFPHKIMSFKPVNVKWS